MDSKYTSEELNDSLNIPDEYSKRISKVVRDATLELRKIGFGWDTICNFAYMATNGGLYDAEVDEKFSK